MLVSFQACTKDNLEDISLGSCDTINMTYTKNIAGIFEKNCYECHNQSYFNKNIKLDRYGDLRVAVNSGKLWKAINHFEGVTPMPYQRSKLPECEIAKIKNWINNGMPY